MKSDFYVVLDWLIELVDIIVDFISENWLLSLLVFVPIVACLILFVANGFLDSSDSGLLLSSARLRSEGSSSVKFSNVRSFGSLSERARARHQQAYYNSGIGHSRITTSDVINEAQNRKREHDRAELLAKQQLEKEQKQREKEQLKYDKDFNYLTQKFHHYDKESGSHTTRTVTINKSTGEVVGTHVTQSMNE